MTTPTRPPSNSVALPEAVQSLVDDQGWLCGCTGQCERTHAGGRCDADEPASLTVAPADLSIPLEHAATLPAGELIMWCLRCRDLAQAAARRRGRERVDQELEDAQLGLWGGS